MPLPAHMSDLAQRALVDHLFHSLVELAVAPLKADLQCLFRPGVGQLAQFVDFFLLEDQALLAENVLACE